MGPDCRTLLDVHDELLGVISVAMLDNSYAAAEAEAFVGRHSAVLKPLKVVSRLTRKVTDGVATMNVKWKGVECLHLTGGCKVVKNFR